MFLLVFAVPALLVVVAGYLVGFGLWTWIGGSVDDAFGTSLADGAEVAGWITGGLLLAVLVRVAVLWWRRTRRRRSGTGWP